MKTTRKATPREKEILDKVFREMNQTMRRMEDLADDLFKEVNWTIVEDDVGSSMFSAFKRVLRKVWK